MARPTVNTKRVIMDGNAIMDGTIRGPKLGTAAAGLTALPTAAERRVQTNSYGVTPGTAHNVVIFRAPASGATILGAYWGPGSAQNHAVNEADTWTVTLKNSKTGLALCKNTCSLSNQTLAATAFKTIPLNNGNSTVLNGHMLRLECAISGSPAALQYPLAVIEWVPYSNA